jgi:acyl carrier protein
VTDLNQSNQHGLAVERPLVAHRLCRTIAAVLGVDAEAIDDASSPETLESWDSLNHLNLVMAIEEEFNVELTPDDTLEMRDVGRIRAILATYGIEV